MKDFLKKDERIDDLEYNDWKIIQNKNNFCFGIDSVLLSDFSKDIKNNSKVLDLGTGTGIIGILLCGKTRLSKIIGVEIQKDVADMAIRSIKLNNLQNKFEIINEDIKNLDNILELNSIDAIVTNPPYKKNNTGAKNDNKVKLISRHEIAINLEDIIKMSSKLLKDKGEFYMVHRPDRLVDITVLLRKYNLEPKIIKFIYPKKNKKPNLILIKAIKNANPYLIVEEPLFVYNENNKYSNEILKIYNKSES